jgi:hypothetical protein
MSSMTQDETYNGYANRETWAFNLHWQNDQGFYNWVLESAREVIAGYFIASDDPAFHDSYLGEKVVGIVREELADMSPELWELLREDVGSFWRIDYAEVGAAVRESLEVETPDN